MDEVNCPRCNRIINMNWGKNITESDTFEGEYGGYYGWVKCVCGCKFDLNPYTEYHPNIIMDEED